MKLQSFQKAFPNHVSIREFSRETGLSTPAIYNRIKKKLIKIETLTMEIQLIPRSEMIRVKQEIKAKGKMNPGPAKKKKE